MLRSEAMDRADGSAEPRAGTKHLCERRKPAGHCPVLVALARFCRSAFSYPKTAAKSKTPWHLAAAPNREPRIAPRPNAEPWRWCASNFALRLIGAWGFERIQLGRAGWLRPGLNSLLGQ